MVNVKGVNLAEMHEEMVNTAIFYAEQIKTSTRYGVFPSARDSIPSGVAKRTHRRPQCYIWQYLF